MRNTIALLAFGLLAALAVGTWTTSNNTVATAAQASLPITETHQIDPLDMMKSARDLPVHNILDAI